MPDLAKESITEPNNCIKKKQKNKRLSAFVYLLTEQVEFKKKVFSLKGSLFLGNARLLKTKI